MSFVRELDRLNLFVKLNQSFKSTLKTPFLLALDIGTSSIRTAIYDCEANVLPVTMVKNKRQLTVTKDGGFEIDADEALSQVSASIDACLEKCPETLEKIEYAATSSFWHSLLGIDSKGNPTTKVFAWAETRPARHIETLRKDLNEKEIHDRTGCRFHSSYWTAKLLWLRKESKEEFEKTEKWISFSDYVALKLFGVSETSVSMASGTGLFDIRENVWDSELLGYLKIDNVNLPEIAETDTKTFQLVEEYKRRWKLLKDTKWFLAIGDGAANNIGASCTTKERAALMIGTSGAMRVAFEGDVPDEIPSGLWCYRIDRKRIIIGGAISDGGGLYHWLKDNLQLDTDNNCTEEEIKKREPNAHGLTFLPFLAGERSTGYNDHAKGAILGLKASTDTIDIVQAAFESVAYRFAEIYDQLNKVLQIKEIIASGGALRESPTWTQIICDTFAKDMCLPNIPEASSRGAVLLALEAVGSIEDISQVSMQKGDMFKYNKNNHKIYLAAREKHKEFYKMLIDC